MNIDRMIVLLENSGIRVLNISGEMILLEDPTCWTRSIEQVMTYLWIGIAVLTAFLLLGWAVSLIRRGEGVGGMAENFKTLVLVLFITSAAMPIANAIWGGDLFGQGCKEIAVPMEKVQEIIDAARNARLAAFDEDNLYEEFDIYDSGIIAAGFRQMPAAATTPTNAREVIYTRPDGTQYRKIGGSVAWRQNNPGNIENSAFSRGLGARDGPRFAIFPDEASGMQAIVALLRVPNYQRLTMGEAISRWAPPFENDTAAYQRLVEQRTGISVNTPLSSLTEAQLQRMAEAIRIKEGWTPGTIQELG